MGSCSIIQVEASYKKSEAMWPVVDQVNYGPGLTVVIAVVGVSNDLLRLVRLLVEGSGQELKEVLLVHNGTESPGLRYQSALRMGAVRLVLSPPGLANARNAGLVETRTELLAFLDHDVKVSQNWSTHLVQAFTKYPTASVIGGEVNLIWPDQKPTWLDSVMEASLSAQSFAREFTVMEAGQFLVGANLAFRSAHLRLVGGFPSYLGRVGRTLLSNEELVPQMKMDLLGLTRLGTRTFSVDAPVQRERLTRNWLIRRFAWQAVSDELSDAFDEPLRPADLGSDTLPIDSFALTEIRATVRSLLRGAETSRAPVEAGSSRRSTQSDHRKRAFTLRKVLVKVVRRNTRLLKLLRKVKKLQLMRLLWTGPPRGSKRAL